MDRMPHQEINCIPSQLNTSKATGVAANLASVAVTPPEYNNFTIEQMRGNPIFGRGDEIDLVGKAQKSLADSANIVKSKSRFIRALNEGAQKIRPKS